MLVSCLRIFNISSFGQRPKSLLAALKLEKDSDPVVGRTQLQSRHVSQTFQLPSVAIWFHFTAGLEIVTELLSLPPRPHI